MGSKFTKYDLVNLTDYSEFEAFCHNLMARQGYRDIEPLGGSQDKGRDAIHVSKTDNTVTIFAYSVREDWQKKLHHDLDAIKTNNHQCDVVVFITTEEISATKHDEEKQNVQAAYGWKLTLYDLERIATLVDSHHQDLITLHPSIFVFSNQFARSDRAETPINRDMYAEHLLASYQEWLKRYTPLRADHRELETYVISTATARSIREIAVTDVPHVSPIAVILGESGAGKTTALWRIVVETSKALKEQTISTIPILISLRAWSTERNCRKLVYDEFSRVGASDSAIERELQAGNCLILIDGLNELAPVEDIRTQAYKDIQHFLVDYSRNRFVICCRTIDYTPRLLDFEQLRNKLPKHEVFEIRRLDRPDIVNYIANYFEDDPGKAQQLIAILNVHSESQWAEPSSFIQLVRIPLYLQLILTEYRHSGKLLNSHARLLRVLIHRTIAREGASSARVDLLSKERLLGSLAFQSIRKGYVLRLPEQILHSILRDTAQNLKQQGFVPSELTVGMIWQEILSNNYLRIADWPWIEWLHQLIFDYFFACEIVRIQIDGDKAELIPLNVLLSTNNWEAPCSIAVGLSDPLSAGRFIEHLLALNAEIAERTFAAQTTDDQAEISRLLISEILEDTFSSAERLERIAVMLPYSTIIENLFRNFRLTSETDIRSMIARSVAAMLIEYYPSTMSPDRNPSFTSKREEHLHEARRRAVKRAIEVLQAWIGNRDELVRFYAAKGLWEHDKGKAAQTLTELLRSTNPNVIALARNLCELWGLGSS